MIKNKRKFSVCICGLGNIGLMYDYHDDSAEKFLTHFKAFNYHPDFNELLLVDPDETKLSLVKEKALKGKAYKVYKNVAEIVKMPDLMVLSASPDINFKIYSKFKERIDWFLVEKPFLPYNYSIDDESILTNRVTINYPRKFVPELAELKHKISEKSYGSPIVGHIWYTKGLRNNGSHLIDFCNFIFGNQYDIESIHTIGKQVDYNVDDPTYTFSIDYQVGRNNFPIIFQAADERFYSLIEMDFLFKAGRIRIIDFGFTIEEYMDKDDPLYPGYKVLAIVKSQSSSMDKHGYLVADHMYNQMVNGVDNLSPLKSEAHILEIVNKVRSVDV